MGRYSEFGRTD